MGLGFLANPQQDDGLATSVKEGGAAPPSLPPLPPASPSPSILAPRFCWSLGGGAAIYKGEWVGGMGLADTEAEEKFPGKSQGTNISTNHIPYD